MIEEVFHCPAVSLYGTSETGIAGWECREHRMHFELDAVVPEVVDDRGSPVAPGETGGLLLTSLKSTVMPIIRYDTGDMAQLPARPCPCGRRGPSIGALEGRAGLVLVGRSGRTQPPYLLMSLIDELGVGDFQLVQDVPGTVRLVVAAGSRRWPRSCRNAWWPASASAAGTTSTSASTGPGDLCSPRRGSARPS